MENDYNRYLINENFKQFGNVLNKMCPSYDIGISYNNGNVVLLPFCYNCNQSYNSGFSGGYSFNSSNDYKIKFKSLMGSSGRSVILNIMFFSPALLSLVDGQLYEELS
jgi:hypothetical protein